MTVSSISTCNGREERLLGGSPPERGHERLGRALRRMAMTENMKKFLEKVSPHGELAKRIQPMTNGQIIHMAQEMGISLTVKDFEESE